MKPLKCDKVYNTIHLLKENVYKLQAIVLNFIPIRIIHLQMDSYYLELILIVVVLHIT
jgi:hypothetical protein